MKKYFIIFFNTIIALSAVKVGTFIVDQKSTIFSNSIIDSFLLKIGYIVLFIFLYRVSELMFIVIFPEEKEDIREAYKAIKYTAYLSKQRILKAILIKLNVKKYRVIIKSKDTLFRRVTF